LRTCLATHRLPGQRCSLRAALRAGHTRLTWHLLTRSTRRTGRSAWRTGSPPGSRLLHPRNRGLTGRALRAGLTTQRLTGHGRGLRPALRAGSTDRRAHIGRHRAKRSAGRALCTGRTSGTRLCRGLSLLHPRLRLLRWRLIARCGLIAAHHRHSPLRNCGRTRHGRGIAPSHRCGDGLCGLARRAERRGLHTRATLGASLCAGGTLFRGGSRGNSGGGRDFVADLSGLLRLGVVFAHDRGEI